MLQHDDVWIRARIGELRKKREIFLKELCAHDGAIQVLEELLSPPQPAANPSTESTLPSLGS